MSQTVIEPDVETTSQTQRQPPYAVILHDDPLNTMPFVVAVLRKVFSYETEKCVKLMMEAHETGRSIIWTGALEVAELKAEQVHSCGADPDSPHENCQPLAVTVEPIA